MTHFYYEIQCYGEGHKQDFTYYLNSNDKLSHKQVIEELEHNHVGNDGLEQHHIDNIVTILPISAEEFAAGSGIEDETPTDRNKFEDAIIAIRDHGWKFTTNGVKTILAPPENDQRRFWATMWDENGFPHWLPAFSTNGGVDPCAKGV